MFFHLPISRGCHFDIRVLRHDLHSVDILHIAHRLGVPDIGQDILSHLTIPGSSLDVVCCPPHEDLTVPGHALHLVILAVKGKELSGEIFLEYLAVKLGSQVLLLSVFVLSHIGRTLQVSHKPALKTGV